MSSPPGTASRHLGALLFGTIGGGLAIAGFFLPWYITNRSGNALTTFSGWDIAKVYLTGKSSAFIGASTGSIVIPYAILTAIPLLLAVTAFVMSGASLITAKTNLYYGGMVTAAGVLGLLSIVNIGSGYPTAYVELGSSNLPSSAGLGLVCMNFGYFGVVVGGIISLVRQSQRA